MKKASFISAIVVLSVLASTAPASALGLGVGVESQTKVEMKGYQNGYGDDNRKDGRDSKPSDMRWKSWMWNSGIAGTITDIDGDTLTVKGTNNIVYTVDADDAKIRGMANATVKLEEGDNVFIQGVVSGTNVVASLIIDAKGKALPQPNDDEKRTAIAGTVTARSGATVTVLAGSGTTYKVDASNASIWKNKSESASVASIDSGESIIVQGSVSGTAVTATKIYVVEIPEAAANGGMRGTVTAINGDTITFLATGGTTYTVDISDADFRDGKGRDEDKDDIDVGEMLVVTGDVSGSSIEATSVYEVKANNGFFHRFGLFFKGIFGKKDR